MTVSQTSRQQKTLLTVSINHDDIVLLIGLIKTYFGTEAPTAQVRVNGSRPYVWEDLDLFLEQCPRLSRVNLMSMHMTSDTRSVAINFRRRTTRLMITGSDDREVGRCLRRITDFLMNTRPRLWPSYKMLLETPKVTIAAGLTMLAIGYLFNSEFITCTLLMAAYVVISVLWLNPNKITFKDRDRLRADAENRMKRLLMTPIAVVGGLLGIVGGCITISSHLH